MQTSSSSHWLEALTFLKTLKTKPWPKPGTGPNRIHHIPSRVLAEECSSPYCSLDFMMGMPIFI